LQSFLHRDVVTHVAATRTDFFVTASADGHLKFWKRTVDGVEFVKHYRSHPGPVLCLAVSADGEHLVTCGGERVAKVFDVAGFDMMNMLNLEFVPGAAEWCHARGEAVLRLAISDAGSGAVAVFDAREAAAGARAAVPLLHLPALHAAPVRIMRFNPAHRCVLSGDARGVLELWEPGAGTFPAAEVAYRFKAETDLYCHATAKTAPQALAFSPDGAQFATFSLDRRVRVCRFATGKLRCVLDESLAAAAEAQRTGPPALRLEDVDFGRRMALERELDRAWAGGAEHAPPPSLAFDESGHFLLFPTHAGVKVVNLHAGRCVRVLGRLENERFLSLALAQGPPARDRRGRATLVEVERRDRDAPVAVIEPVLLGASAFKRHRVYFFSRREPADTEDAAVGRDVFNERPVGDELAASLAAAGPVRSLPAAATIHTSLGDICLRLFPDECPRTVENWVTLARQGYYDGLLVHRVMKGFMIQTGDPLGDGTGGLSCWGGEFEDEFRRDLRHDRPYTLSMANAGPGTNASQFFITTVATPWLDNKHTVFGRVTKGADVVHLIERVKTDRHDKPLEDIKMLSISLQ